MPFSPLGKGFLTGKIDASTRFDSTDTSVAACHALVRRTARRIRRWWTYRHVCEAKNATPAQIALAWLLDKSPGSSRFPAQQSCPASKRTLARPASRANAEDVRSLEDAASEIKLEGARYPDFHQSLVGR